jgi:2,4-dichlorophenol 6-monooxygenase
VPDDLLVHHPTTSPGHHLPHAWLDGPRGRASTLDLHEPGRWLLLVDEADEAWRAALADAASPIAASVDVVAVGPTREWRSGPDWAQLREVGSSGALLVRPDAFVAWRTAELPADPAATLHDVLGQLSGVPGTTVVTAGP